MVARVITKDLGFTNIVKALLATKDTHVTVGVHGDVGSEMVEIASVHEFGSLDDGPIPERSYIRLTLDLKRKEFAAFSQKVFEQVADGKIEGKKAARILGQKVVSEIKRTITKGDPTWDELLEATIRAKGSSKPLIDTGQLRAAIRAKVIVGKKRPRATV